MLPNIPRVKLYRKDVHRQTVQKLVQES